MGSLQFVDEGKNASMTNGLRVDQKDPATGKFETVGRVFPGKPLEVDEKVGKQAEKDNPALKYVGGKAIAAPKAAPGAKAKPKAE